MKISCISFTARGAETAARVREVFSHDESISINLWICKKHIDGHGIPAGVTRVEGSAGEWTKVHFQEDDAILFIGACGIAVREIAPCVRSKVSDPAVIVVDEAGHFAISLLSGHLGGANALTAKIAEGIGAQVVITTATDLRKSFAVDLFAEKNHLAISDMELAKEISAAILDERPVGFFADGIEVEGEMPEELSELQKGAPLYLKERDIDRPLLGMTLSLSDQKEYFEHTLSLVPKGVILGVGCRRGKEPEAFEQFVLMALDAAGISMHSVVGIRSIDVKAQEAAIVQFADKYGIPYETYTAQQLSRVPGRFSSSPFVAVLVGVDNVCERAAVLGAMDQNIPGRLILNKEAREGMTLAAAMREMRFSW